MLKKRIELYFLVLLALFLAIFLVFQNTSHYYSQLYSVEAYSFIHGHLDLIGDFKEKFLDTDVINNKIYFAGDPGTAILMLPLAYMASFFNEVSPQWILNVSLLFFGIYNLNKILLVRQVISLKTRVWLIIAFFFATSIVSIIYIPNTWNIAQTAGLSLSLFYITEWLQKRRFYLLMPLFLVITFTRKQFFLPMLVFSLTDLILNLGLSRKVKKLLKKNFRTVLNIILILITSYSSFRLYSWWYYKFFAIPRGEGELTQSFVPLAHQAVLSKYGQFNKSYVTRNIYYYLFNMPEPVFQTDVVGSTLKWPYISPSPHGTSFILLSPIFLSFIFFKTELFKQNIAFFIAAGSLLYLYLNFFTSGQDQFGLRYSADIVPFLFIPLIDTLKNNLSPKIKFLITTSALFNCYLLISFFASGKTI